MDMRIPPLQATSMLESNPPESRILVWRLAVSREHDGKRRHRAGQTTCLALPVERRSSLKVANNVANYGGP